MKPILLSISGLNSFIEEQTIDFSKLTEKGLFGIFGPTGSGKSTILDAITIALYGQISRGTKEFINTDCEKLNVSFIFEVGCGHSRKRVKVERQLKKSDSGTRTTLARLCYLDENGNETNIIDKVSDINEEIIKLIGLNNSDFIRSVVLPQGRFSDFLKLTGSERRNMLERILGLEKYGTDLTNRVKKARKEEEAKLNVIQGQLNKYEDVNEENLKLLKEELKSIEKEEIDLKVENEKLDKEYEKLSKIWDLQVDLKKYKEVKEKLKLKKEEIELKREKYLKGKNAQGLKPYINNLDKTLEEINKNEQELKKLELYIQNVLKEKESLEKEYTEISLRKNKELPSLIEKETELKNVVELHKKNEKLILERNKLREKYSELKKAFDLCEKALEDLKLEEDKKDKELKTIEEKMLAIKVSSEFRDKVIKGLELEKKYIELGKKINELEEKNKKLKKDTVFNQEKLKEIEKLLNEKKEKYKIYENKIKELEANKPKDTKSLLDEAKMIENLQKKERILRELSGLKGQKQNIEKEIKVFKEKLNLVEQKLDILKKEIDELELISHMNNIVVSLKEGDPCPVCGSMHHPKKADVVDVSEIKSIKENKLELEKTQKELNLKIEKLNSELYKLIAKEENLTEEMQKLDELIKDINLENIKQEIENRKRDLEKNESYLKKWNEEYEEYRKKVDEIKENLNNLEKEKAVLLETIRKDNELIKETFRELEANKEEYSGIEEKHKEVKNTLKIKSFISTSEEIKKKDLEYEELESNAKRIRESIKEISDEMKKLNDELGKTNSEMNLIKRDGQNLTSIIEENNIKIQTVSPSKNPLLYLDEVRKVKEDIIKKEEETRNNLKNKEKTLKDLQLSKEGLLKTVKTLKDTENNIKNELTVVMSNLGFKTIDEIRLSYIDKDKLEQLEKEINDYDDEVKKVNDNIKRVETELKGETLSEDEWNNFIENRKRKKEAYSEIIEKLGMRREKIRKMEEEIIEVKKLERELKVIEKKVDMLNEISDLIKGNRFVEYVAISHLKYIAREASKRLMEITNNRYSLELDSKGNFVICDNYNGGVKRDVNTLSGGETFMTSLSLALALSTQIQLKGNTSIEFFFLDEGFGTLDSSILDVVMTSLEKLQKEKLSVGIISHVDELKDRVPVKLIVKPAVSGVSGTKVKIEYS
ncbi:hypothetical protein TR13x_00670 [Caloranaerobacter sp. TR13]|nr:hypothetical protein TR13x_00670 [Caloranaerobacter sp. TR13]